MDQEEKQIRKIQKKSSKKEAELLIKTYYDQIYRYVYRQIGKEKALDLTQEIFIAMLHSIKNYDFKKASFKTWLYRVAQHKIIDYRRRFEPIFLNLDAMEIPDEHDFLKQMVEDAFVKEIKLYVSHLDSDYQDVFHLRFFEGHTFLEMSLLLNQSESTIKTRYYRLLKILRKEFAHVN